MKLYEINEALDILLSSLMVDEETGEVPVDIDDLIKEIDGLQMERQKVLEYLAKEVINLRADETALKTEESRLKERREKMERREQSILKILDRECKGERTNLGVATLSYRASETTDVVDEKAAIEYLRSHGYTNCVSITEPKMSVDKSGVKALIKQGIDVPGITLTKKNNVSLK